MASIKFKNALGVERGCEEGFGGIDITASQISSDRLASLVNLDISADGSLKTRKGYREKFSLSAPIRATLSSGKSFYCLAGNELTLTDTESGSTSLLATTETDSGDAELFFYGGKLYLHDSNKLFVFDSSSLVESDGYAPLYGKNWHPILRGEINEDINLASDRIRISYITAGGGSSFDLGIRCRSLDRVEINGEVRNIEDHGIILDGKNIDFTKNVGLADDLLITFWLTLDAESSRRSLLADHAKAFVFSNGGGERLCLYSPGASSELLCSRALSKAALSESRKTSAGSSDLYIPASSSVCIGNGGYPITGMAHHFDRALLFTDANAWCVDFEGDEADPDRIFPKVFLLNSAIGSELSYSSAHCENDPLTYYRGRIFRWHSQSGVRDECSAELISEAVSALLPEDSEHVSMLSIPHRGLLLISDSDDIEGKLLVYNTERKAWTVYSGIFAEKLFIFSSSSAFSRRNTVYVFSDDLDKDTEEDESFPIISKLISHFTDFDTPERTKRAVRVMINGEIGDGACLELENERGEKRKITLSRSSGCISERLSMPRFKRLRYKLESRSAIRLDNIILSAK